MSETSQSLHFWSSSKARIRRVLQDSAVVAARIVAENQRWICVVPSEIDALMEIAAAAGSLVAIWSYTEDVALEIIFYEDGREVGQLVFVWFAPPGFDETEPESPIDALVDAGVLTADSGAELAELREDVRFGKAQGDAVRDRAAKILGLAAYEWLSPEHCLELPLEAFRKRYPDAEDVEPEEAFDA